MSNSFDLILTVSAVIVAAAYLIRRKIIAHRNLARDWSSGHAEVCGSCPAIKARRELKEKLRQA